MDTLTITQLCKAAGVSREKLYCCEKEGLVMPVGRTEGNYRLYDVSAISELRKIMRYQDLHFTLKEIAEIFKRPDSEQAEIFNRKLTQLNEERKHLDKQIFYTKIVRLIGADIMFSEAFDDKSIDEIVDGIYANSSYRGLVKKLRDMKDEEVEKLDKKLDTIFRQFSLLKDQNADSDEVLSLVDTFFDVYSEYASFTCANIINYSVCLSGKGRLTADIDQKYGSGTAEFMSEAFENRWIRLAVDETISVIDNAVCNVELSDDDFASMFIPRVCHILEHYIGEITPIAYDLFYECLLPDCGYFSASDNNAILRIDRMMKNYLTKGVR